MRLLAARLADRPAQMRACDASRLDEHAQLELRRPDAIYRHRRGMPGAVTRYERDQQQHCLDEPAREA
jgi:hypothetical protein